MVREDKGLQEYFGTTPHPTGDGHDRTIGSSNHVIPMRISTETGRGRDPPKDTPTLVSCRRSKDSAARLESCSEPPCTPHTRAASLGTVFLGIAVVLHFVMPFVVAQATQSFPGR
jgi:hypothetical protein